MSARCIGDFHDPYECMCQSKCADCGAPALHLCTCTPDDDAATDFADRCDEIAKAQARGEG